MWQGQCYLDTHSSPEWRLERPLSLRGDSRQVPPLARVPVRDRGVLGDSVIPHHDRILLPLDTHVEISTVREVVVQELQNDVGFLLLEADDVTGDCFSRLVSTEVPYGGAADLRSHQDLLRWSATYTED